MFQTALKHIFPQDELTFVEVSIVDTINLSQFDAVCVCAGDLLNDFYGIKYRTVLAKCNKYKIALGVGVSFESCLKEDYNEVFDDIMIRNKTDILPLSRYIGSNHVHSIPDLVFSIPFPIVPKQKFGNKVGVFLVGSLIHNTSFMFSLISLIDFLISNSYIVELIPMYTDSKISDNDIVLNNEIYEKFSHTGQIFSHPQLSIDEFFDRVSYMDFGICIRFHAHVICTCLGVPFLSIPITRKDEIYISELPETARHFVKLSRDSKYNVLGFDVEDSIKEFKTIVQDKEQITSIFNNLYKQHQEFYKSGKVQTIVHNRSKRLIVPPDYKRVNPEQIYKKYLNIFLKKGINPFTDRSQDKQWLHSLADELCYEITSDPVNDYMYGTRINFETKLSSLRDIIYYIYQDHLAKYNHPKININYMKQDSFRGLHRAGWQYAIDSLYCLSDNYGTFLDTYVDRTFGWASTLLEKKGIIPYTNSWIGFIHHTFDTEFSSNNCTELFKSSAFKNSLPLCRGLFCLTEYLAKQIREKIKELGFNITVEVLMHPTVYPKNKFDIEKYKENGNRRLINIGSWYRNPTSIYQIPPVENIKYTTLKGKRMESSFCPGNVIISNMDDKLICETNIWTKYFTKYIQERGDDFSKSIYDKISINTDIRNFGENRVDLLKSFLDRVDILETMSNESYDELLCQNIVFLNLVDASVANTIIECIVRFTPLIVNRIPPTVELLGENYPLFYDKLDEIPSLLEESQIERAYNYLRNMDQEIYRIENFVESFCKSSIYKRL